MSFMFMDEELACAGEDGCTLRFDFFTFLVSFSADLGGVGRPPLSVLSLLGGVCRPTKVVQNKF